MRTSTENTAFRVGLFTLIPLLLVLATPILNTRLKVLAQSEGTITGTVIDQSGAVVPNAQVTAVNQATGVQRSVTSAFDGRFTISVPIGQYTVKVNATGFKTVEQSGVGVQPAQEAHLRIVLFLGSGEPILGQIRVTVKDEQGHLVPAAIITVTELHGSPEESGKSDDKGEYVYSSAPPGDYSIRAEAPGAKHAEQRLHLKKRQTKNVTLTLR